MRVANDLRVLKSGRRCIKDAAAKGIDDERTESEMTMTRAQGAIRTYVLTKFAAERARSFQGLGGAPFVQSVRR